jgi:hypothetical protein
LRVFTLTANKAKKCPHSSKVLVIDISLDICY